jgi:hypothetical protein
MRRPRRVPGGCRCAAPLPPRGLGAARADCACPARAAQSADVQHRPAPKSAPKSGTRACSASVRGSAGMAAPKVSQLGGGISKGDIGASTRTYVSYFEGKNAAGKDAGARKRNYTDVVNKCVPRAGRDRAAGRSCERREGEFARGITRCGALSRSCGAPGTTIWPPASTNTVGACCVLARVVVTPAVPCARDPSPDARCVALLLGARASTLRTASRRRA